MLRTTRSTITLGAIATALAVPAGAVAQSQDLRSPDARDAAGPVEIRQDLRSPDARDAATPAEIRQDLRSPDARDAATPVAQPSRPVPVVDRVTPSGGFEWGHAGIGGAATLALVLGIGGLSLLVARRRVGTPFMH